MMLLSCLSLAAFVPFAADPVPSFESIPKDELFPKGAKIEVAADGSLTVNGKPRYFPATQWYGQIEFSGQPSTNIEDCVKWFYEGVPNYRMVQRLGLDAGGFYGALAWMKRLYRPWFRDEWRDEKKLGAMIAELGLPMYVDMTASEWSHGSLWHSDCPLDPKRTVDPAKCQKPGKGDQFCNHKECGAALDTPGRLSAKAWTVGHQHWVPWSIVYPQGREIWLNMWENIAKDAIAISPADNHPWCYELMNEPSCFDTSDYAKETFRAEMKSKFGSLDKFKDEQSVAYLVEYTKFMEEHFASLLAEGASKIRALDPAAKVTFQPCTIRTRGIDLFRTYANLDVVCSQTGGRGLVEAAMLRGLADGKPIVDNEMYIGNTTNSVKSSYLTQYIRGFNISYSFKWEGQKSGYNFMNRNNVQVDALMGSRLAKRDVMDVNEFFTPRKRGVPHEVAILFSSPTERVAEYGIGDYKAFDHAVSTTAFEHIPFDVIYEDQMTNTTARLGSYKVLICAGTQATYPGTCSEIKKWTEKGGSLVLINSRLALNEYGEKNPESFTADLANDSMTEVGKGSVRVKDIAKDEYASFIREACAASGIRPTCSLISEETGKPAVAVEVHEAVRGDQRAWAVVSNARGGQLVRFTPGGEWRARRARPTLVRVWNQIDVVNGKPLLVSYRQAVEPNEKGEYILYLTQGDVQFFVEGTKEQLAARYPKADDVRWLNPLTAAAALASGKERLAAEIAARVVEKPAFEVDPNKCHPIDLRKFVNRRFIDKVAKDGKDGWVDQGAKFSLEETPWGVVNCNGVPMDFIRYDQNGYHDCLVMKSTKLADAPEGELPFPTEVKGIPVDAKAKNVYFLHGIGWGILGRSETAFTYVFHYEDGSTVEAPCRNFHEVWDWFFVAATADMAKAGCYAGWKNSANRGLYIWRWPNPNPEKRIVSLDIVSAVGQQIPLIVAATVEEP